MKELGLPGKITCIHICEDYNPSNDDNHNSCCCLGFVDYVRHLLDAVHTLS